MAQSLALTLPAGLNLEAGLSSYIRAVNALPILSAEEERRLALRFHREGDLDAARQLVVSHLRFVVRVARGYNGYGLPQADLIQEGNIGLMKAVKHYDPDHGVRLLSFAVHWIRAEIYEFILRNWRIVKIATTKAQRKLFFNLRKSRKQTGWMSAAEAGDLAETLDVPLATLKEMEARMSHADVPFDGHEEDDEEFSPAPAGYLQDLRYNPERLYLHKTEEAGAGARLRQALEGLDGRARAIIERRWLNEEAKATLHELAAEYGVSAERIRQIETKAMARLKVAMRPAVTV